MTDESQKELEAYWAGSITAQLKNKPVRRSPEQDSWDSESRTSPYCTVWSPEQDDEERWQADYDAAIACGYDDATATAFADEAAVS